MMPEHLKTLKNLLCQSHPQFINNQWKTQTLTLTSSDVKPILITGGQLLVLAQLDNVHPVRNL